ncbi:peroxisome assembly protein 26 [Leucoraja erinacea]|uniref:peroxisome assembly protein 26 n=1 Tax=Leucoraja erinaceus TaxID=7782 RepID=UPI00245458B7|nr:peroxisome assembly protein 26 [Leucoraja erinacea]
MKRSGPLVLGRWRHCAREPALCPGLVWLERAADLLQVQRNLAGALAACERGLEWLDRQPGGSAPRAADIRSSLCAMGLQALAERRQWRRAWDWLLQQYGSPDRIPAALLQLCIILYSKAGEPGQIQQAVSSWLKSKASTSATGSVGLVFELYILHVLLPLGLYAEAEKEIKDTTLLTEQQKESVLEVVLRKRPKLLEQELAESRSQVPAECSERRQSAQYTLRHMFRLIQQVVELCRRHLRLVSLRKLLLAVFVAYLLVIRLDPASPVTFSCLTSVRLFLKSTWDIMFSPHYKTRLGQ